VLVERVVILGRGGAGKSVAATRLGQVTGLPVIELDRLFWRPDLTPMPAPDWIQRQQELAATDRWILDGDLGPYDTPSIRLSRADTVLILDFSLTRCAWRAARRSRERADFWQWLLTWRRSSRPALLHAVTTHATHADVHVLRTPRRLRHLLSAIERHSTG
jgi:adenylate kinase family enzyme